MVQVSGGGGNAWAKEMTIRRKMASMCAPHPENSGSLCQRKTDFFFGQAANIDCLYGSFVQIQQDTGAFPYSEGLQRLSGRS
jgi:hypothetical protein